MGFLELIDKDLQTAQIKLPEDKRVLLANYCEELVVWNRRINLTGLGGAELVRRLVVEPVWIGLELQISGRLIDVGSGNGSPGIPIHVACDLKQSELIDSRAKRAAFLRNVAAKLRLQNVSVYRGRLEETTTRLAPDWITLQGVSLTEHLLAKLQEIGSRTTKIVWITAGQTHRPARTLRLPFSRTEVQILDLS